MSGDAHSDAEFRLALNRVYRWYAAGFIAFVLVLALLEQQGLSRQGIGLIFLLATIGLYAGIGIMSRTTDASEYYVAGRRVPAVYNGMATGADWMSAASFISLAGTLYLTGFNGLAFIMGWTGGYCLVAFLLAPYLRRFGQFTIPDFLGERYGGNMPRMLGVLAALLCSFTYVVAQIYGVGIITARLTGVAFELGIFLGLGGILLCSFLGGMRAVTWTQVTQYLVITVAYLLPVVWLSVKQTGIPVPQAIYGYQLQKVSAREDELIRDPKEQQVQQIFSQRSAELAAKLQDPAAALSADRARANREVAALRPPMLRCSTFMPPTGPCPICPVIWSRRAPSGHRPKPKPMPSPGRSMACRRMHSSLPVTRRAMSMRAMSLKFPGAIFWHWFSV